jgi:serine/threonine-protein kinase
MYMAPEQIHATARVAPTADLYAMGHIAFTLLVGKAYWFEEVKNLDLLPFLVRVSQGAPEPATARAHRLGVTLPPAFDAWFARATALQPEQRFQNARTMMAELGAALSGAASVQPRSSIPDAGHGVPGQSVLTGRPGTTPLGLPTIDRAALSQSRPVSPPPAKNGTFGAVIAFVALLTAGAGGLGWHLLRDDAPAAATAPPPTGEQTSEPAAPPPPSDGPTVEPAAASPEPSASASSVAAVASSAPKTVPTAAPVTPGTASTAKAAKTAKTAPPAAPPAPPKPKKGEGLL